ncbi:MAG: hypothetical protein ACI9HE_004081, partial [Planctomycetota bacterium]
SGVQALDANRLEPRRSRAIETALTLRLLF